MKGKMLISRSQSYISVASVGMILFLFLSKLKELEIINISLREYLIPIYFLSFVFLIIIGYIELYLFKGYREEVNAINAVTPLHPQIEKMKKDIEEIKAKLL